MAVSILKKMVLYFLGFALALIPSCGVGLCSGSACGGGPSIAGATSTPNADGSITVNITGAGFVAGVTVVVHGNLCTNVQVISSTQLTCILPSSSIPLTDIVITLPGGTVEVNVTTAGAGTFTVPVGITALKIELWGPGGGGGGGTITGGPGGEDGGGGGGGAYLKLNSAPVSAGLVVSYSVGSAGVYDVMSDNGTDGGNTTCTTFSLVAQGGKKGTAALGSAGGLGGTATGGNVNLTGANGTAQGPGGNSANGGAGGASGGAGIFPGGGGSGGLSGGANSNGGDGANGKVLITYTAP